MGSFGRDSRVIVRVAYMGIVSLFDRLLLCTHVQFDWTLVFSLFATAIALLALLLGGTV